MELKTRIPTEHIDAPSVEGEGRSIQARGVALNFLRFLAIIMTALYLVPGGAHLFVLPNKIHLAADQYLVVQSTYRGWHSFGFVLISAILIDAALAIMLRANRIAFVSALVAVGCLIASLAIFFLSVFPANVATDFWTTVPDNWQGLRRQWEYGHAASAVVTFVAFCSVTFAALTSRR